MGLKVEDAKPIGHPSNRKAGVCTRPLTVNVVFPCIPLVIPPGMEPPSAEQVTSEVIGCLSYRKSGSRAWDRPYMLLSGWRH